MEVIPWGLRADSGVTEMEAPPSGALVGVKWKPNEENSPRPIAAKESVRDSRLVLLEFSYQKLLALAVNHPVFDRMTRIAPTNPPALAAKHPNFTEGSFSSTSHSINHDSHPQGHIHTLPHPHTQPAIKPW